MNIEVRFLIKAIEDKNYVSFSYEDSAIKKVKLFKFIQKEAHFYFQGVELQYDYALMKNIQILKERFK